LQPIAQLLTVKNMFSAVKYVLRAIGKREKNNARRQDGVPENDLKHACNKNWPINIVLPFS